MLRKFRLKKCLSRFAVVEEFKAPKLPVRNISKNFDTKQEYWITINHVITPNQFYANFLLDSTMELEQLESDLKMHYKEHSGKNFMWDFCYFDFLRTRIKLARLVPECRLFVTSALLTRRLIHVTERSPLNLTH